MIISLNWLRKYVEWDMTTEELVELIGSRLVEVEEVIDERGRYDNVFCVKVVECEKIPETKLSLCKIDVGKKEMVQVVCGAPNVRAGMMAAWIAPGATVPASWREDAPFVLGVRKLQGYESNGMLAGADELGFGDDHSGIAELDPEVCKPGDRLAEVFGLDDILLDIENKSLTHRPDCFGIVGFAREVAGILGKKFVEPEFLVGGGSGHILGQEKAELRIKIADAGLCPRYEALVMRRKDGGGAGYLTEMQTLIARAGMRPIDPIVDVTNYLMLLTGQPLHAFDYDKLVEVGGKEVPGIQVRAAREGEKMVLLDGREIEMCPDDIVICSGDTPVALAGAMGGANTVIDKDTRRVIVESATFSLFNLRKTQMRHGIFSEAITRFTKGQPAGLTDPVIREFARETRSLLTPLGLFDEYPRAGKMPTIEMGVEKVNKLLGTDYSEKTIVETLQNVGVTVSTRPTGTLTRARPVSGAGAAVRPKTGASSPSPKVPADSLLVVTPPFWRTDLHIAEDVVEEVGRLLGYDNIVPTLPAVDVDGAKTEEILALKSQVREIMSGAGANEVLSYSFVHGDLLTKVGEDVGNSYKIVNSLSPELEYFRQQIVPSLIAKAYVNIKEGEKKFALFEMNQVFMKPDGVTEDKVPVVNNNLGAVYVDTGAASNYYAAKLLLEELMRGLGIEMTIGEFAPNEYDTFYEPKRSAGVYAGGQMVGVIGELRRAVATKMKVPEGTAVLEIGMDGLEDMRTVRMVGRELGMLDAAERDVTVEMGADKKFINFLEAVEGVLRGEGLVYRVSPVGIWQGEGAKTKKITVHLELASRDKVLSKGEIAGIMEKVEKVEVK